MNSWKNLLTIGASGRINKKIQKYDNLLADFQDLLKHVESRRSDIKRVLEKLIRTKVQALESLKLINTISENLSVRNRQLLEYEIETNNLNFEFDSIQKTIEIGDLALNSIKGIGAGISTALGAWALVGTFGTASTGTAISTLSGAAAVNATLAYLGGGALSVGGGGMVVGTAVLGGLVVIPALVITGAFCHLNANKKIREIAEKETEVIKAIDECGRCLTSIDLLEKRANELIDGINKSKYAFEVEYDKAYKKLFPNKLSKVWKSVRKFFTGKYFSNKDIKEISYIGQIGSSLAILVDQKLIDENGNPT